MEAASARYAARDRFSAYGEPMQQSTLQRYIQNAVDPQNFEPNLALDLEIADLINSKKGNAPREAAVAIVNYINHRNANVSMLALTLLDICVKNCGYPFHLQISTKEFLNELVRRFPERPPMRPSRVQLRILEAIEEWRQTICQTSRYKEDLGFIRDMHRLLSFKGYMFPEVRREDAAVLNPSDNLKSAEEMEEEEHAAHSAKLQELIRRGGPEDLQEANKLMKIMAGYDTRHKTDYRAKAAGEVGKIQQKAKLLEERLQNFKPGDKMQEGDVFEDLASSLQSAHPKIQKMCEEESDDQEAVAKLFEINDSINRTIERYKLIKKGDLESAQKIPQGTLGTSTGVAKNSNNELSLIDFGGDQEQQSTEGAAGPSSHAPQAPGSTESLEEDLLGLSFQDQSYGQSGGIALGFGANRDVPGPSLISTTTQPDPNQPNSIPQASPDITGPDRPKHDAFSSLAGSGPPSKSTTPRPLGKPSKPVAADPFSILANPVRKQQSVTQQAVSMFDFAPPKQAMQSLAAVPANGAVPEDDWNFSSALPEEAQPSSNTIVVADKEIKIMFDVSRRDNVADVVDILAKFSNKSSSTITDLTFQIAVTKV
jgi:ADP-ribosylation factor-binding protein GGA